MKILNVILSLALVTMPLVPVQASEVRKQEKMKSSYQLLTREEMEQRVGGLTVGQITIIDPENKRNVSSNGWVDYRVYYQDITGKADFVLFTADSGGTTIELDRVNSLSDSGYRSGTFHSSLVKTTNNILVAELISHAGSDPYDACKSSTSTIYARGMRQITGNGK